MAAGSAVVPRLEAVDALLPATTFDADGVVDDPPVVLMITRVASTSSTRAIGARALHVG
jgi:hypothetical protein